MKKLFIFVVLSIFVCSVFADFMVPTPMKAVNQNYERTIRVYEDNSREAPGWEFVVDPISLLSNYYDYMPGSYNSTPVRLQPDAMGGIYITFHAREAADATRRVYFAYIDASGSVTNVATISNSDVHEGYCGIDIDPVSGDPLVAWHANMDAHADLDVVATYDLYHLGNPGLWRTPFIVLDDTFWISNPTDYFIWPYVFVGPSPDPAKRRVYIQANNGFAYENPSENIALLYADFDVNDLNNLSELDWTINHIPLLDEWNQSNPEWIRPFHSMDVSKTDGKVAFFGYNTEDKIHVFLNENYGEGDFEYISLDYQFDTWNPQNQDESYYFADATTGAPYTLYWSFIHGHHFQSIFTEGSNKLNFSGNLGLQCYEDFYWPMWIYPKAFQYDLNTQEFTFHDLYITGANPDDNIPMVPWDLDEDGEVDSYTTQGSVEHVHDWPIYYWVTDQAFHDNNSKTTSNEDNGWMVNIWQDGTKCKYYNDPDWADPDYIAWAETSEVMISISSDGGATWSDPIIMNAKADDVNYVQQFDEMGLCYFYLGDRIEDLGDGWGLVHLFFLDDDSFGCFSGQTPYGSNAGGTSMYAAIKIDFSTASTDDNTVTPSVARLSQNYPNPFNPSTTVAYNLNEAGEVSIEIYNIKGQKVCTLVDDYKDVGRHTIQWNGRDDKNQSVSSGVYFYKMKSGVYTDTKKMILLK